MMREGIWSFPIFKTAQMIPFRERLKNLYFIIFGPRLNKFIAVASILLLLISIFNSDSVLTIWYHVAEGILTFFFAGEIALRLVVMRGDFWESSLNVFEALACALCITIFFILNYSRQQASLAEHQVLIILRYLGQLLRLVGLVAVDNVISTGDQGSIQLFTGNNAGISSNEPREYFRDVL